MSSDELDDCDEDEPILPQPGEQNARVRAGGEDCDSSVVSDAIDLVLEEKRVATAHPDKVRAAMGLTDGDSASPLPSTTRNGKKKRKGALTPGAHPISGLALAPTTSTSAVELPTQQAPRSPSEMAAETGGEAARETATVPGDAPIIVPHATVVSERNSRLEEEQYDPEKLASLATIELAPAASVSLAAAEEEKKTDGGLTSKRKFQAIVVVALFLVVVLLSVILVLVLRAPKNERLTTVPAVPGNGKGDGSGQGGGWLDREEDRDGQGGQGGTRLI